MNKKSVQIIGGVETSWEIRDVSGSVLESGSGYKGNTEYIFNFCLWSDKCYNFVIKDKYGDGICCKEGQGSYSGFVNNLPIFSGGKFQSSLSHRFCVGLVSATNAPLPTGSPTTSGVGNLR